MLSSPESVQPQPLGSRGARLRFPNGFEITPVQLALMAAIVLYAVLSPGDVRFKLDALGFGVCHQITSHSFYIGGHQLPLCARCSGIYLGAAASVGLLVVLRGKSSMLPARHLLVILGVFFASMVADGLNSTLQTLGSPIWDSTNVVRLLTGSLAGIAVAFVFYPLFNLTVWRPDVAKRERVLQKPLELLGYMLAVGVLVALVLLADDLFYYPIAFLSIVGLLVMLTMANTMIILSTVRRDATYTAFSQALTPLLIGLVLSLVELTLLAWGRTSLAPFLVNNMGMPLFPGLP